MIQYIEKAKIKTDYNLKIRNEFNTSIAKSIREDGVLSPLILLADFTLIDGFSRFNFSKAEKLPAVVLEDRKKAFFTSVQLNMLSNPYSEFEKARAVKLAVEYFKIKEEIVVKELNPLLKFSKKLSVLKDCLNIFKLDKGLFNLLESKKSPISFALLLTREDRADQKLLADFFKEKRFSLSRMQIAYDLMYYIRKRESLDFAKIIEKCQNEDFFSCLERLRFPKFTELKGDLNSILSRYPGYINFPRDFEAGFLSFSVKIKGKDDVEKAQQVLKSIKNDNEIWDFLRKIKGND